KDSYSLRDNETRSAWIEDGVQFNATYNNRLELSTVTASNGTNIQYVFDRNGNRIEDDLLRYQYDVVDNLVRVVRKSTNAVVLEHAYDGQGRVIERRENGISRLFVYNEIQRVHE